jgi:4-carboxymuconolactone decarboxylase
MRDAAANAGPRPTQPRVAPIERVAERAREFWVGRLVAPINLSATLAHCKPVSKAIENFSPFTADLIEPRLRELVILRTGWNAQSIYEWGQHVMAARAVGIADADLLALRRPLEAGPWTPAEAAALQAVDDLCDDNCVTESTWSALSDALPLDTAIAVIALCGHYRLVSGVLNSLGIQPEPGLPDWDLQPAP